MPYTIIKTNGTLISSVQDGTIDAKSLDITLVGKNYSGYGNIFNENFVKLLENFANTTSPLRPTIGQLWFDSTSRRLKINTGIPQNPSWKSVGVIENSNSKPTGYNAGDLWWKTDEGRLYAYTGAGTTWTLVGPLSSKTGASGALESTILRAAGAGSDTIIKLTVNGEEAAVVSDIDNTINGGTKSTDPSYNLYPLIKKGITLPAYISGATDGVSYRPPPNGGGGYILWGTAASALGLVSAADGTLHYTDEYLLTSKLASLTNKIFVNNDNGVLVGIQGVGYLHVTDSTIANVSNVNGSTLRFNIGSKDSTSTQSGDFYNVFYISSGTNNTSYILPNPTATVYLGTATQTFDYSYITTGTFSTVTSTVLTGATINGTSAIRDNGNRVITSVTLNVGNGISGGGTITGPTGTLAFTNTGILSVTGTSNQVNITTGQNPVFSLPQNIDTGATVNFARVNGTEIYDNTNRVLTTATRDISLTALRSSGVGAAQVYGTWALAGGATFEATYTADIAERYASDAEYGPGTVLIIGGIQEVTVTTERANVARAGIVSTEPAFKLNGGAGTDATHPYIALKGRVPCFVTGMIEKGDLLVTSAIAGHAEAAQLGDNPNAAIGRALANFVGDSGVIEVMVI
jgi:hypothetical protein